MIYHNVFWETMRRTYLGAVSVPSGSVAEWLELRVAQLKNIVLFGMGIPLVAGLILAAVGFFRSTSTFDASRARNSSITSHNRALMLIWASLACSFIAALYMQISMIRYTLPFVVLAAIPVGHALQVLTQRSWGRALSCGLILCTGWLSFLQLGILVQEHTINQAFHWIYPDKKVNPGHSSNLAVFGQKDD